MKGRAAGLGRTLHFLGPGDPNHLLDSTTAYHVRRGQVQRAISRSEGSFVFNAGKWQAKLGDRIFHGYYTAIVVREGDQPKIMEETVTVASEHS